MVPARLRAGLPQHRQAVGMRVGEGSKEDRVDGREHRRVRADSQSQGQDRRDRKPGRPAKRAQTIAHVVEEFAHGITSFLPKRRQGVDSGGPASRERRRGRRGRQQAGRAEGESRGIARPDTEED